MPRRRFAVLALALLVSPRLALAQLVPPVLLSQMGSYGSGPGQLDEPYGVVADASGRLYVADTMNSRIEVFSVQGDLLAVWGGYGGAPGQFRYPRDIKLDASGDVVVCDTQNHRIQVFTPAGVLLRTWGSFGTGPGQFDNPYSLTVGPDGSVYVVDAFENDRIQVFTGDGTFLRAWSVPSQSSYCAFDHLGRLWVTEPSAWLVQVYAPTGTWLATFGNYGDPSGPLHGPAGIAVDSEGRMWIASWDGGQVEVLTQDGVLVGRFGSFNAPTGVAIDPDGRLVVSDIVFQRVSVFAIESAVPTTSSTWGRLKALYR